ncbi:hypothetical protein J2P12_06465, partial [Candidatus Bathyarchaeota archaeon]|nr:hypothetical protein [Candidatus Bathyarchaeota archaeon]
MVTRHELTFTILLVLIILSVVPSIHQTNATDASPDLGAKLFPDFVQVSVNLHVFQNLTQLEPTFTFPQYNATLSGDNSTTMASDLQTAIRNQAPQATVTDLTLQLVSTSASNSAQSQWFNVSFQFHMGGVQTVQNGIQRVDLGWKSFNVPQNVSVGHVEINNIGQSYLYQPAIAIAALERSGSGSVVSYSNIVNYFRVTPPNLASRTVRINLLNFTQLLSPVDTWQ